MRLKSVEIFGFKSFGKKTVIDFSSPVTAIVGPNGSGKSNIVDAVRWVLGEQRVKSLRGNKMEDVIFSGSENKRPLGYAQVSIILDNSDGMFRIDYDEIELTRRLFRSGDSEYLINKTKCRLLDIQSLLMDTGLSREGYSIISQGQIESIVNNSPQERKLLIEEAVGIVKYKTRRTEAEKKLEKATGNLYRINDLISEIEGRLPNLKKQAQKAETFRQLSNELRDIEVSIFVSRMDILNESLEKALKTKEEIEYTYNDITSQISDSEEEQKVVEEKISLLTKELNDVRDLISGAEEELNYHNGLLAGAKNERTLNLERISLYTGEAENINSSLAEVEEKKKENEDNISVLNDELIALKADYDKKLRISEETREKREASDEKIREAERKIGECEKAVLRLKENSFALIAKRDRLLHTVSDDESEIIAKNNTLSELNESLGEDDVAVLLSEKKEELAAAKNNLEEITSEGEAVREELSGLITDIQTKDSRLKLLKGYDESLQGYKYAVRKINDLARENEYYRKGIRGILGEVVKYRPEHAQAISRALGGAVEYIITTDEQVASLAIGELKKYSWGRLTFLPQNIIKPSNVYIDPVVYSLKGFVGLAAELTECDKEFRAAVDSVLYKTVVADNLENANKIAAKLNYKHKIVTLDGDVIMSGGAMVGGKSKNEDSGVLGRKAEIAALEEEIIKDRDVYDGLLKKRNEISEEYKSAKTLVEKLEGEYSSMHEKATEFNLSQKNIREKIRQTEDDIAILERRIINSGKDIDKAEEDILLTDSKIKEGEERLSVLKEERNSLGEATEGIIGNMQELSEAEIVYKSAVQRMNYLSETNSDLTDRQERYLSRIAEKNESISLCRKKISELEGIISEEEKLSEKFTAERDNYKDKHTVLGDEISAAEGEKNNILSKIRSLLEDKASVTEKIGTANNTIDKIGLQIENLSQNMLESYDITYDMAKELDEDPLNMADLGESLQKVGELKDKIKRLGNINADAIEEYQNERARFDEMTIQRDDLISSKDELKGIIDDISQNMLTQFKREFAVIQKEFNNVFRELFNGGEAKLILTDPDDVLNSGVDIAASPPGTKLKNISALSGGEKTMTAISLIFAIIKIKPSPFIVLDEIDAALDDANVVRYCNYLRSIQKNNQFVIITHKKKTMENSDVLYGATMNNDGITKIVSVKLSDINEKGELK